MIQSDYKYLYGEITDFLSNKMSQFKYCEKYNTNENSIIHNTNLEVAKWMHDFSCDSTHRYISGPMWEDLPNIGIKLVSGTLFKTPNFENNKD